MNQFLKNILLPFKVFGAAGRYMYQRPIQFLAFFFVIIANIVLLTFGLSDSLKDSLRILISTASTIQIIDAIRWIRIGRADLRKSQTEMLEKFIKDPRYNSVARIRFNVPIKTFRPLCWIDKLLGKTRVSMYVYDFTPNDGPAKLHSSSLRFCLTKKQMFQAKLHGWIESDNAIHVKKLAEFLGEEL